MKALSQAAEISAVFLFAVGAAYLVHSRSVKPAIRLSVPVLAFADIPPNQTVSKTVEVRNNGNAVLVIESLQAGCGCTKTWLSPSNVIRPGEASTLHVSVEIHSNADLRKISTLALKSNDPKKPVVILQITIAPRDANALQTKLVDFGRIDRTELPMTRKLVGTDGVSAPGVCEVMYANEGVEVIESGTGETREVSISIHKEVRSGDLYSVIGISDRAGDALREISIRGHVLGEIFALPQALMFTDQEVVSEAIRKRIDLHARATDGGASVGVCRPIEISLAGPIAEYVSVDYETDNGFVVTADFAKMTRERSTRREVGEIVVKCTYAGESLVVGVPVIVDLKEGRHFQPGQLELIEKPRRGFQSQQDPRTPGHSGPANGRGPVGDFDSNRWE